MLNLHLLECTLKGYDHISDLLLAKYWVITGCKYSYCSSLTNILIPNSVKEIEGYAFLSCYNLQELELGQAVNSIGVQAFDNCSSLSIIKCKCLTPPEIYLQLVNADIVSGSFPFNENLKIYVPTSLYDIYVGFTGFSSGLTQKNWSQYKSHIEPYDF